MYKVDCTRIYCNSRSKSSIHFPQNISMRLECVCVWRKCADCQVDRRFTPHNTHKFIHDLANTTATTIPATHACLYALLTELNDCHINGRLSMAYISHSGTVHVDSLSLHPAALRHAHVSKSLSIHVVSLLIFNYAL